eukprot:Hpha_TRINITY_DN15182_c0_g1::TRINITY_DN15182_c0_g1_i1::g.128461::m.128461/K14938/NVD, DAF36; cholesterol 7-desaturase
MLDTMRHMAETATTEDIIATACVVVLLSLGGLFLRWASRPWIINSFDPDIRQAMSRLRGFKDRTHFPTGWYAVCRSSELGRKEVKDVVFCGVRVALWRGSDGKARAVDAYCAHLGANMGQGDVVGNMLRCPFHHWSYNGDGKCTGIPYAKPKCIPTEARVNTWQVLDQDDQIYIWFSRRPGQEPHWTPRVRNPNNYQFRGSFTVDIRGKVRSVTENSADIGHFQYIHAKTWSGWRANIMYSQWTLLQNYTPEGPFASIIVRPVMTFFNFYKMPMTLRVLQMGPGMASISTTLPFNLGGVEILQCAMPTADSEHCTLTERIYADSWFGRFVIYFANFEVLQDSLIWREQLAKDTPVFVPEVDGEETTDMALHKYRKWFTQFEAPVTTSKNAGADEDIDYAAGGEQAESPDVEW